MENAEADCRTVLERLYLYLDGEIAGGDCASIDAHLERCMPCLKRVGLERDVKQIIASKCREERLPDGLVDRVRARLRDLP